jgi:cystatin-A/B
MMCGGFGGVKNADDTVVAICNEVKSKVENHLGQNFQTFEPVHYKTQVVAGTNYLIKVRTDSDFVHVKVHKPLPHNGTELSVMEASAGHSENAAL